MNSAPSTVIQQLDISGMRCGHCVSRVTRTLESIDGVTVLEVHVGSARLTTASEAATEQAFRDLADLGYTAKVTVPTPTPSARTCCGGHSCCA